ncbi:MAG: hypothetical protein CEN90_710 [Parcubacteria group bacterium Licking1014_17]|nr:MAG: hypothetical protein CEN90_710 [Parcubacteria group bacterium Licking1014_17]
MEKESAGKPYKLPIDKAGKYDVTVKAVDKAGNYSAASTVIEAGAAVKPGAGLLYSIVTSLWFLIIVALVLLLIILYLLRKSIPGVDDLFADVSGVWKSFMVREHMEKESGTRPEVLSLQGDIKEELGFFDAISRQRELNPDEKRIKEKLEKCLRILR